MKACSSATCMEYLPRKEYASRSDDQQRMFVRIHEGTWSAQIDSWHDPSTNVRSLEVFPKSKMNIPSSCMRINIQRTILHGSSTKVASCSHSQHRRWEIIQPLRLLSRHKKHLSRSYPTSSGSRKSILESKTHTVFL